MNDLFIARNDVATIEINQHSVTVRQVLIKELDVWLLYAKPLKDATYRQDVTDELLIDTFSDNTLKCMGLIDLITDVDIKQLDIKNIPQILKTIIEVNQAYFEQKEPKLSQEKSEATWFDGFQLLIQSGHTHDSVMNMSYGSYVQYLEALQRIKRIEQVADATTQRIAQHADKKGFEGFVKSD